MRDLACVQGGDLRTYAPGEILVDLSNCANREGPAPSVKRVLREYDPRALVAPYYEGGNDRIRDNPLARAYAVHLGHPDPDRFLVANGISEFLYTLSTLLRVWGPEVALIMPEYSYAVQRFEYATLYHPAHGELDTPASRLKRIRQALNNHTYVYISNPSNPLGLYVSRGELLEACAENPQSTLIVDEAYIAFQSWNLSLGSLAPNVTNLVVMQSVGKSFGIPGARAGVLWTRNDELRSAIAWNLPRLTMSALDTAVAVAALEELEWLYTTTARVRENARRLDRLLAASFGEERVVPSDIHWRFLRADHPEVIHDHLRRHRIATRLFTGESPGQAHGLRITAPREPEDATEPEEWERLTSALTSLPASAR